MDIGDVFFQGFRKNQDVIQIDGYLAINDVTEDVVDQGLEDGVRESERHDTVLVLKAVFHSSPSLMQTRW